MIVSVDNDSMNNFEGHLTCKFSCFGKYREIAVEVQL